MNDEYFQELRDRFAEDPMSISRDELVYLVTIALRRMREAELAWCEAQPE